MRKNAFLALALFLFLITVAEGATVTIYWGNVTMVSQTSLTLQVVVNPYILRDSPIWAGTFQALADLRADYVRFVPWLPYPRLGVAELQPPTGNPVCGSAAVNQSLYLGCYEGHIKSVEFASFGHPTGRCGSYNASKACNSPQAQTVVEKFCLGQASCVVNATTKLFGIPCNGSSDFRLAAQVTCSPSVNKTFWNFTIIDPVMEDFMDATDGHSVIINFSTIPEWMWNTPGPVAYPADPKNVSWSYEQGTDIRDPTMHDVAMYYQRLISWYTNGGLYDEYGVYHESGHYYDIPMWEVLNEIQYEHGISAEQYNTLYDAVVKAILEIQPNMQFVGLALGGRDLSYVASFLNKSNHAPGIPLDWVSYHFYASPQNRTIVSQYPGFFTQADELFVQVSAIQRIRRQLAPWVKTTMDEIGVILPGDFDNPLEPIPDIYWNAAGAMYAYIFGNLIYQGIEVLGESQLVGYPTQYPSVSMMNWITGRPNARYWVLYLLHTFFHAGDKLVETSFDDTRIYAQAFVTPHERATLVINKSLEVINVTIPGMDGGVAALVADVDRPPTTVFIPADTFMLPPFAVAVVTPA